MRLAVILKNIFIFFVAFFLAVLCLGKLSSYLKQKQDQQDAVQNQIILEDVRLRFKQFVNIQTSIGIIGAEHFSTGNLKTKDYGPLNDKLLEINRQIFGMNLLDENGKIVRVFPEADNIKALGVTSQNYHHLKKSFEEGETFWLSPPTKLFQGDTGLIMYFPIVHEKMIKGWFAIVVKSKNFSQSFELENFLKSYDLAIKDTATQGQYFATGIPPESTAHVYSTKARFHDRDIEFISWNKNPAVNEVLPKSWIRIGSLLIALMIVMTSYLYNQRRKARYQLKDIKLLLNLTSKEAMSKLIDLQQESYKIGNEENARYITNLIEQIDLLKSTASSGHSLEQSSFQILDLIKSEIDESDYLIKKKGIELQFKPETFPELTLRSNYWLFKHAVVRTIITYAIIHADNASGMSIDFQKTQTSNVINLHVQRSYQFDTDGQFFNLDRRIDVAKKVLSMSDTDLRILQDLAGGLIIQIEFPT